MRVAQDTLLLFQHSLRLTLRNPAYVIIGLFQPLCQLFLFAPLLGALTGLPGFPSGGAFDVFTPGLLVMLSITSALFVGFGFLSDLRAGVLERLQVTDVSRLALVLGRSLCDVLMFTVQALILLAAAWLMGMRADPLGVALAMVLLVVLSLFTSLCSYALALRVRDENVFASMLNFLMLPLLLLSGITLPLSLGPGWLQTLGMLNPFTHAVNAARDLFRGQLLDRAVIQGFLIVTVLTGCALVWAVRSFRRTV
jgi:ABC-2 type transport system permease protein